MPTLIENMITCFVDYNALFSEEKFQYHSVLPLYQPDEDIIVSSAEESISGSEYESEEEEEEGERAKPLVHPTELQTRFLEESGGAERLTPPQATVLARKLGFAPSRLEERELEEKYKQGVTVEEIEKWLEAVRHPEDTPSYLKKFFRQFDNDGSGYLSKMQFNTILTSRSGEESLTQEEVNSLLSKLGAAKDPVNYNAICDE